MDRRHFIKGLAASGGLSCAARHAGATPLGSGPSLNSASYRLRQPIALSGTSVNRFITSRYFDRSLVATSAVLPVFANEHVTSKCVETPGIAPLEISYSLLTRVNTVSRDQSQSTRVDCRFSGARGDARFTGPDGSAWPYLWKRDVGSTRLVGATSLEFLSAGGSFLTTGDGYESVVLPGGWLVIGDPMAVALSARETYAHQVRVVAPANTTNVLPQMATLATSIEGSKAAGSYAGGGFNLLDWTRLTGVSASSGTGLFGPLALLGYGSPAGTVMLSGDSIGCGAPGDNCSTLGSPGLLRRATLLASVPSFSTTVPSSNVTLQNATPQPLRDWLLRLCAAEVQQHIHNGGKIDDIRLANLHSRSLMLPGARVFNTTPTPQMTGGQNAGHVAISAITSADGAMTITAPSATVAKLKVGQWVVIGDCNVGGYDGQACVLALRSDTSFTATMPGAGTGLPAASTGRLAVGPTDPTGGYQFKTYKPWLDAIRANPASANLALGDPDNVIDVYAAVGGRNLVWSRLRDTHDGSHPLGQILASLGVSDESVQTAARQVAVELLRCLA